MTKKLEELFNLPDNEDDTDPLNTEHYIPVDEDDEKIIRVPDTFESRKNTPSKFDHVDKISAALPFVGDLGSKADKELDDLHNTAVGAYNDLMDFAMNIEPRYAGRIFEVANSMLKTGLDAKMAKVNKKLKMIELQLKHERINSSPSNSQATVDDEGEIVSDRNTLLEQIKNMQNKDK